MSNRNDNLVDEYLNGSTPYSSHYGRTPADDVPPELDRVVLARAAQNIEKRKAQLWWRMGPALAIAATLVLTVSIVMRNGVEQTTTHETTTVSDAPSAEVRRNERDAVKESSTENEVALLKAEAESAKRSKEPKASNTTARLRSPKTAPAPVPNAGVQARKAEAPPVESAPMIAQPVQASRAEATSASARMQAAQQRSAAETQADAAKVISEIQEVTVTGNVVRSSPQDSAMPVSVITAEDIDHSNPKEWLKRIRQLRKEGKQAEADEEWRAFVQAFPNYSVSKRDTARPKH